MHYDTTFTVSTDRLRARSRRRFLAGFLTARAKTKACGIRSRVDLTVYYMTPRFSRKYVVSSLLSVLIEVAHVRYYEEFPRRMPGNTSKEHIVLHI